MKKRIGLLLCILLLFTVSAYAKEQENPNTITVQGSSIQEITPDQATLFIGVTSTETTAEAARNDNAQKASALQNKLTALGIDNDNIKTSNYSIYPLYGEAENIKPSPIIGYRVNNTVKVTLNDLTLAGTVLDNCVQSGANEIENIKFSRKDELGFEKVALSAAVNEASAKAEAIAQALGKKITGVVTVTENGVTMNLADNGYGRQFLKASAVGTTPIQAGSIKLQATVTVVFEMQ